MSGAGRKCRLGGRSDELPVAVRKRNVKPTESSA